MFLPAVGFSLSFKLERVVARVHMTVAGLCLEHPGCFRSRVVAVRRCPDSFLLLVEAHVTSSTPSFPASPGSSEDFF